MEEFCIALHLYMKITKKKTLIPKKTCTCKKCIVACSLASLSFVCLLNSRHSFIELWGGINELLSSLSSERVKHDKASVSENTSGGGGMWSISPTNGAALQRCIDENTWFDFQGEAACLTFSTHCTLSSGCHWLNLLIPASINTEWSPDRTFTAALLCHREIHLQKIKVAPLSLLLSASLELTGCDEVAFQRKASVTRSGFTC